MGGIRRSFLKCFVNLPAMLSVGVEGHLSRLFPDESQWGGSERKREGAQQTASGQQCDII